MKCQTFAQAGCRQKIRSRVVAEDCVHSSRSSLEDPVALNFAGASCALCCSSSAVRDALRSWSDPSLEEFELTLAVEISQSSPDLQPTHFRGMEHLVVTRYGENTLVFDLLRRSVDAWISKSLASDSSFWGQRIIPLILGVMGCTVGVLPLHSACVVKEGRGILLAGASMAGKSTLTVALAKQGWEFLSDDWVYVRNTSLGPVVYGLNIPVKLLADARMHFTELQQWHPVPTANGEVGYELDPTSHLGFHTIQACTPSLMLFLERVSAGSPHFVRVADSYVREYVNHSVEQLPSSLTDAIRQRGSLIAATSNLSAWRYRYAGTPQFGAAHLTRFIEKVFEVTC